MKKDKKKPQDSTYSIFERYNRFISGLYLEKPLKKPTRKEKTRQFLAKLAVVFVGSLFTTLTFYFLINPNGIYNSGLNGLLQTFSKIIVGQNKLSWSNYYLVYYGLGLTTNLLFIIFLRVFFKAKLEVISTSLFYVLSQVIWTKTFDLLNLKEHIFSRFNPSSWQGLSSQSQLSFTLPYYIVIAVVAAIIHTYGYSLIFQAQATPGGFEILTSHFSSQKRKKKFSISTFMKIFGLLVIFAITIVDFFWVENNSKIKESILKKEMIEVLEKEKVEFKEKKLTEDSCKNVIDQWKKDMGEVKKLKKQNKSVEVSKILDKNYPITSFLKSKVNEPNLENYPKEVDYYLIKDNEKPEEMSKEITEIKTEISKLKGTELEKSLQRKNNLEKRKSELENKAEKNLLYRYLSYVSNNERLWATMVYIFVSSFLISQIFPREKIVLLHLHSSTEEEKNQALKLLRKFNPTYYKIQQKRGEKEETIYVINCRFSKWNYYILKPYLKQVGKSFCTGEE